MVKAIIELPNGKIINIEVNDTTNIIDIINYLELNSNEIFVFIGRLNGEIGTPLSNLNNNFRYYNMWFPEDKSYNPSIVILDITMNTLDKYKYDYYKSLGY